MFKYDLYLYNLNSKFCGDLMLYLYEQEVLKLIKRIVYNNSDLIYLAVLYGSLASGKHTPESDVDVLIVGKQEAKRKLLDEFSEVYLKFFIPISLLYYTLEQFKKVNFHTFIKEVLREGKILWKRRID